MQKNKDSPVPWDGRIRGTTQIAPSSATFPSLTQKYGIAPHHAAPATPEGNGLRVIAPAILSAK